MEPSPQQPPSAPSDGHNASPPPPSAFGKLFRKQSKNEQAETTAIPETDPRRSSKVLSNAFRSIENSRPSSFTHRNDKNETGSSSDVNREFSRKTSFFRNFIFNRANDYHSDAAEVQGATHQHRSTVEDVKRRSISQRASISTGSRGSTDSSTSPPSIKWYSCLKKCFKPSPRTLEVMKHIISSKWWSNGIILFFTIILLFGAQMQELIFNKEAGLGLDGLFTVTFVVLLVDIIMRCFTEPAYYSFQFCDRKKGGANSNSSAGWGSCQFGSFMFWCDLISTLLLIYNISYISNSLFPTKSITIMLDENGVPMPGQEINSGHPINMQYDLLVVILRTMRMARFIRASTVAKTSRKANWYRALQLINPLWYYECCRRRHRTGIADRTPFDAGGTARKISWGTLSADTIAHMQASQTEELPSLFHKAMVVCGLRKTAKEQLENRIKAAITIQRCIRSNKEGRLVNGDFGESQRDESSYHQDEQTSSLQGQSSSRTPFGGSKIFEESEILKKQKLTTHLNERGGKARQESQVGSAMRELTGQRVAIGIIISLLLTVLFTYLEEDATRPSTMIVLHGQTEYPNFRDLAINASRRSSTPDLFYYNSNVDYSTNETISYYDIRNKTELRSRDISIIYVQTKNTNRRTEGRFSSRTIRNRQALVELATTIFMLFIWFFGVMGFTGPVMTLVVTPIERMVRLLGMLMVDPLGYQSTSGYRKFVAEEDLIIQNSRWTKEVLKGMETSFLMSTILRIGSLMKVGFGSAGVEIIRNNLEKGQNKDTLFLNSQGTTVACIFLFCDIRQFTDATESLQEEVFLFTNKIAAVVHSICHSYGGSANKNIGDAFLLTWLLDDEDRRPQRDVAGLTGSSSMDPFAAKHNQADKALLSVVKISIALHHDKFYLDCLSDGARDALVTKLSKRKGPVVQLGFGLHAGKAIQGALGSQRKIDATYVSEAVERSEFLESSTKKYGTKMLMSGNFHRLLHANNRRRCRKVDQILINNEDDDFGETIDEGNIMELFTFDINIDALWKHEEKVDMSDTDSMNGSFRSSKKKTGMKQGRRRSLKKIIIKGGSHGMDGSDEFSMNASVRQGPDSSDRHSGMPMAVEGAEEKKEGTLNPELVLPTGPALYNSNVWRTEEMRKIRHRYSDGLFFQKFSSGLQSYYNRDWDHARQCFETILERFADGPSQCFLDSINENNGVPPRGFVAYGTE